MTSNAGSNRGSGALGFAKTKNEASKERAMKALNEFLRPEFIGRVDEIAVFNDLTSENYKEIAVLMLNELVEPLENKGIKFTWSEDVPVVLAAKCENGTRGARDLRNAIRRNVEDKIANLIVENASTPLSSVALSVDNGEIFLASL